MSSIYDYCDDCARLKEWQQELQQQLEAAKLREAELLKQVNPVCCCGSSYNDHTVTDNHSFRDAYLYALETAKQERNAALSTLETARTALEHSRDDFGWELVYKALKAISDPSAALAEHDRAIRQDVVNQMEEMEVLLPIDHWGGTKQQLLVEFHKALIANARQKFGV